MRRVVIKISVNAFLNFPSSPTPIEIIGTGGGTNMFWSGGDFSHAASVSIYEWR
jgi:hypothetical protein